MRLGGDSAPAPAQYKTPAQDFYEAVLEQIADSSLFSRIALKEALERREPWSEVPANVRELFEGVARRLGISDPET